MNGVGGWLSQLVGARRGATLARWLLPLALLASTGRLFLLFHQEYAWDGWLVWRYAGYWLACGAFAASALSVGDCIVRRLSPAGYEADGHWVLAFATGVLAFFFAMFVAGLAGLWRPATFFVVPALLFAIGAPGLFQRYEAARRWVTTRPPWTRVELLLVAIGGAAVVLIYLPILTPDNTAYDARWYHLGLAEHYVAIGGIARMPEGPLTATIPHLATFLYGWAFLMPFGSLFDRVELAAHVEMTVFLATLAGVPALVRWLVPEGRHRVAWVAFFLFPSIFVYDTTLCAGADHIAALFTIPVWLACARAWSSMSPRACALFAVQAGAILVTKYTAAIVLLVPVAAIVGRGLWLAMRGRDRAPLTGLGYGLLAGVLVTSPQWLKNWVWYGDPLYPMLNKVFTPRPWNPDAIAWYARFQAEAFAPVGTWDQKLGGAFRALYDYSYALYNWPDFHGKAPIVGSLFTFTLAALPFLSKTRRIWALVIGGHVAIFAWYLMAHQERYLQAILPWMVAAVFAIMVLVWRHGGWPSRVALVALVSVQAAWGIDVYFYPSHKMHGQSGIRAAVDFLAKGYRREPRTAVFAGWQQVHDALPAKSKALVHHTHDHLGIGVPTVTDFAPGELGLNYGRLGSLGAVHEKLRSFGVTHVVYNAGSSFVTDSFASDLLFWSYARFHLVDVKTMSGLTVGKMPPTAPTAAPGDVLVLVCDRPYANGLYPLADVAMPPPPPGPPPTYPAPKQRIAAVGATEVNALAAGATYAVIDPACSPAVPNGMTPIGQQGSIKLYGRAP